MNPLAGHPFWRNLLRVEATALPSPFGVDPTNVALSPQAGTNIEPSVAEEWARRLRAGGWRAFPHMLPTPGGPRPLGFPAWASRLFPGQRAPDLVAVHPGRRILLVGDVTAQPRSGHLRKTLGYAQQLAQALRPDSRYAVLAQERYWGTPLDRARALGILRANVSPRFVVRPGRESEGGEGFDIHKSFPFAQPAGHEELTRAAAVGVPVLTGADVAELVEGVRRVDLDLKSHVLPGHQPRHVLRSRRCLHPRVALVEARTHLGSLHGQALAAFAAGNRPEAFRLLGEALHLIQDSYSAAHTERDWRRAGGPYPVVYVRAYHLTGPYAPHEHGVLTDPRDHIRSAGRLTREAAAAQNASHDYLRLAVGHLGLPATHPRWRAELRAFANQHLVLSPRHRTPAATDPACRGVP